MLTEEWTAIRMRILRADGYRCKARDTLGHVCGAPANQADASTLTARCRRHHA